MREILPYSLNRPVLEHYADIRRALRPLHGPRLIGDIDTLIAATALERDLALVTTDTDYERIPGLSLTSLDRRNLRAP